WTFQKRSPSCLLSTESSRTVNRCRPMSGITSRTLVAANAYPYSPSATEPKRRAITAAIRTVASRALASPANIDALLTMRRRGKARALAIIWSTPVCLDSSDVHQNGLAAYFVAVLDCECDASKDYKSRQEADQRVQQKNRSHRPFRGKRWSDLL